MKSWWNKLFGHKNDMGGDTAQELEYEEERSRIQEEESDILSEKRSFPVEKMQIQKKSERDLREKSSGKGPDLEDLKQILAEIEQETKVEVIKIKVHPRADISLTNSNFGGLPYIPMGGTIPLTGDGAQMQLLAQINCSELPANQIYPRQGMLQFWIYGDDLMGADFDNALQDDTKRVIYYPVIESCLSENEVREIYHPEFYEEESFSPFSKGQPFGLSFDLGKEGLSACDFRFEETFIAKWNSAFPDNSITSLYDEEFPDEFTDYIFDENFCNGHKIGGYPFFTQTDPREYGNKEYTILLLQIDSEGNKEYEIMWGDVGVANFFATPRQLKMLDFGGILYTWDCG